MAANPFTFAGDGESLAAIIKSLEMRWGLTLVSFFSPDAQSSLIQLQQQVSRLWGEDTETSLRRSRPFIKYYHANHFHCTHFTLVRSDPGGPVQESRFVKDGHRLYELYEIIRSSSAQVPPLAVCFDRLRIATDGLGIILLGSFQGDAVAARQVLLQHLNAHLRVGFNIDPRSWDSDPAKTHLAHSCIGYLKRSPSLGYEAFVRALTEIEFEPVVSTFDTMTLVHHRYRSLEPPQEGSVTFPLGKTENISEEVFAQQLHLAQ